MPVADGGGEVEGRAMIEPVTTSKQYAWCATCDGLIVRESSDRIWCHARENNTCHNLVVEPFKTDDTRAKKEGETKCE